MIDVTAELCSNSEGQQWAVKDNAIINLQNPNLCLNTLNEGQENAGHVTLNECPSESDLQLFGAVSLDSMMTLDYNEPMEYFDSYHP